MESSSSQMAEMSRRRTSFAKEHDSDDLAILTFGGLRSNGQERMHAACGRVAVESLFAFKLDRFPFLGGCVKVVDRSSDFVAGKTSIPDEDGLVPGGSGQYHRAKDGPASTWSWSSWMTG